MILLSHKVAILSRLNCTFICLLYYYSIEKTILEAKREDESTLPKGQGLHHKNKFDPHSWSWDVTVDQNYKNFLMFQFQSHFLKIKYSKCGIWIFFLFWHFPPIFVLLILTCLVTLFDRKLQVFKNSPKWTIFGIFN